MQAVTMKFKSAALAAALLLGTLSLNANATTTITFDDLPGNLDSIFNGYEGLDWSNFLVTNTTQYDSPNGYVNGTVSPKNVAFNGYGNPATISSGSAFTLNNAFFTAAWNNDLNVVAVATDGVNTFTKEFTLSTLGSQDIVFNFINITSVTFTSFGGTNPGYSGDGPHFAVDNMTINAAVPEPETYALMMTGLALAGLTARRKSSIG